MLLNKWEKITEISKTSSRWLTLYCERWKKGTEQLDYWRVEKDDSLIIITVYENNFILPTPDYRPGIGKYTLDFPGGRLPKDQEEKNIVSLILKRELGVNKVNVSDIIKLTDKPMIINSSFSDQKLVVYAANIRSKPSLEYQSFSLDEAQNLLDKLECLQCNYSLGLWIQKFKKGKTA